MHELSPPTVVVKVTSKLYGNPLYPSFCLRRVPDVAFETDHVLLRFTSQSRLTTPALLYFYPRRDWRRLWCLWLCGRRQCLKLLNNSGLLSRKPLLIVFYFPPGYLLVDLPWLQHVQNSSFTAVEMDVEKNVTFQSSLPVAFLSCWSKITESRTMIPCII